MQLEKIESRFPRKLKEFPQTALQHIGPDTSVQIRYEVCDGERDHDKPLYQGFNLSEALKVLERPEARLLFVALYFDGYIWSGVYENYQKQS